MTARKRRGKGGRRAPAEAAVAILPWKGRRRRRTDDRTAPDAARQQLVGAEPSTLDMLTHEQHVPANVILKKDYEFLIAVLLFIALLVGAAYLLYRCTELGCRIFG